MSGGYSRVRAAGTRPGTMNPGAPREGGSTIPHNAGVAGSSPDPAIGSSAT
jgi:hypothetical protein